MCLKSIAIIDEDINDLVSVIENLEMKPKYDDTFEEGHILQKLPLDTTVSY